MIDFTTLQEASPQLNYYVMSLMAWRDALRTLGSQEVVSTHPIYIDSNGDYFIKTGISSKVDTEVSITSNWLSDSFVNLIPCSEKVIFTGIASWHGVNTGRNHLAGINMNYERNELMHNEVRNVPVFVTQQKDRPDYWNSWGEWKCKLVPSNDNKRWLQSLSSGCSYSIFDHTRITANSWKERDKWIHSCSDRACASGDRVLASYFRGIDNWKGRIRRTPPRVVCIEAIVNNLVTSGLGYVVPINIRLVNPELAVETSINEKATALNYLVNPLALLTGQDLSVIESKVGYTNTDYANLLNKLGGIYSSGIPMPFNVSATAWEVEDVGDTAYSMPIVISTNLGAENVNPSIIINKTCAIIPDFIRPPVNLLRQLETAKLDDLLAMAQALGDSKLQLVAGNNSAVYRYVATSMVTELSKQFMQWYDKLIDQLRGKVYESNFLQIRRFYRALFIQALGGMQIDDICMMSAFQLVLSKNFFYNN